jgi:hypothetical protein
MVQTKRYTFGSFFIGGIYLLFVALLISLISQYYFGFEVIKMAIKSTSGFSLHLSIIVFALVLFAPITWTNFKCYKVDTKAKRIYITNLLGGKAEYAFEDLDGRFLTIIRRMKTFTPYSVIYLIQKDIVVGHVDEFFCSNFTEVSIALEGVHDFGFVPMTAGRKLNVLLGRRMNVS